MNDEQKRRMKEWVERWKETGLILEKIREDEIRKENTIRSMEIFAGNLDFILKKHPPKKTSGLVEMQHYFGKIRA